MRLSEAMRQGIAQTVPARFAMWYRSNKGIHACAIGAAVLAEYGEFAPTKISPYVYARQQWPILEKPFMDAETLQEWIQDHNDDPFEDGGLTREQIADELEKAGY